MSRGKGEREEEKEEVGAGGVVVPTFRVAETLSREERDQSPGTGCSF